MRALPLALAAALLGACAPEAPGGAGAASEPLLELDHLFVIVPDPAEAVAALATAGITVDETSVMRHDGSGTASLGAMFDNAYLELLWADSTVSIAEGAEEDVAKFPAASRWQAGGPSPFGIGLRRADPDVGPLPYAGEAVEGEAWVEEGETFFVFDTEDGEVSAFVVPPYMAVPSWVDELRADVPEAFDHPAGVAVLSGVVLRGTAGPQSVVEAGLEGVVFDSADEAPLLELTFDGGAEGVTQDLRPALPVVIRR